jgi:hypothetical protein
MDASFPYLSGVPPRHPGPLGRFLPLLEEGCIALWLEKRVSPGAWILEPFGFSPRPAVEAARAGYRVLVAANNPVTRFVLECYAESLSQAELKAALADLAVSRKGEERLETHIQSLYLTECTGCGNQIPAHAFLWRKGAETPYARVYTCPVCGESGERLATPADMARASRAAETAKLHRARVLERIAPLNDPDREYAEEALSHYLPRPLYALATLINRLDSLELTPLHRRALQALLLSACDAGNDLWPHPVERPRPRQLTTPPQFREQNLWLALEEALELWAGDDPPIEVTRWPQIPAEAGICIFEGRLKDLVMRRNPLPLRAAITAIPRPNQAFWTLSALWAGWLWGKESAAPFKSVLRRRRYDWEWHAEALHAAGEHLFRLLEVHTPFFGLLADAEPSFLTASLTAADLAGFDLETLALRTAEDPVQIGWTRRAEATRTGSPADPGLVSTALRQYLRERGESVSYLHIHAAGLIALAENACLSRSGQSLGSLLSEATLAIQSALQRDATLTHYETGGRHGVESGLWGLSIGQEQAEPLPDRVEKEIVRFLVRHPDSRLHEVESGLYPLFPSLLTPSRALIQAVLDSYALEVNGCWRLRPEDTPAARRAELRHIASLLEQMGIRLAYSVSHPESNVVLWQTNGQTVYAFHVTASAIVSHFFSRNVYPREQCLLVLPGGRAGLLAYKLRRDPVLRQASAGWRVIKFRLLRALAEAPLLSRETWEEQINSDPIEHTPGQMLMF